MVPAPKPSSRMRANEIPKIARGPQGCVIPAPVLGCIPIKQRIGAWWSTWMQDPPWSGFIQTARAVGIEEDVNIRVAEATVEGKSLRRLTCQRVELIVLVTVMRVSSTMKACEAEIRWWS